MLIEIGYSFAWGNISNVRLSFDLSGMDELKIEKSGAYSHTLNTFFIFFFDIFETENFELPKFSEKLEFLIMYLTLLCQKMFETLYVILKNL